VFLLDEPLSNLDAKLRVQTRVELIKLHSRLQTTAIYVTHDQVEAMTMGSRIAILRDGVLQQLDTPAQVYDNPANIFVAGFIGSPAMNFFPARIAESEGKLRITASGLDLQVPDEIRARMNGAGSSEVMLGVRPEDIHDARRSAVDADRQNARVDVVEHMGNEKFIHLSSGELSFMARMESAVQVKAGDTLPIVIDARKIHLFDPATEKAILANAKG